MISGSYSGPGWYLFEDRLFWAEASKSEFFAGFIDLSREKGGRTIATMSPDFFDASCTAKWTPLYGDKPDWKLA